MPERWRSHTLSSASRVPQVPTGWYEPFRAQLKELLASSSALVLDLMKLFDDDFAAQQMDGKGARRRLERVEQGARSYLAPYGCRSIAASRTEYLVSCFL